MVESRRKFLTDVIYSFLPLVLGKLRAVALIPFITKSFGSVGYGIWVQYSVTLVLLSTLASLGLDNSLNRYLGTATPARVREDFYSVLTLSIGTAGAIGAILLATNDVLVPVIFPVPEGDTLLVLLVLALAFNIHFRQTVQLLRSQRHIKEMNLWHATRILGEVGCLLIGIYLTVTLVTVISWIVGLYIVISVLLAVHVAFQIGVVRPSFRNLRQHLLFGVPLLFSALAYWIVNTSDRYIITYYVGVGPVGEYAVVYALAAIVGLLSNPIVNILFPDISVLQDEGSTDELQTRLEYVVRTYLLFGIPAVVGLTLLAVPTIRLLSTDEIARNAELMPFLTVALLLYGLFNILVQVIMSYGHSVRAGLIWGGIAVENLLLNFALVPSMGTAGAAIATLISFFTATGIVVWYLVDELKRLQIDLVRIILASSLMGGIVWAGRRAIVNIGVVKLGMLVGGGLLSYVVLAYWFGLISREDIRSVRLSIGDL